MMTGHRNEYTQDTWVDQEALPDLRRLVRQRTRWGQGTMQCGAYLRQLWTCRHVSTIGALEATYYLSSPGCSWSGRSSTRCPPSSLLANYLAGPAAMRAWVVQGGWMILAFYLVVGLGPFVLWGPMYRRRCEPGTGIAARAGPRRRILAVRPDLLCHIVAGLRPHYRAPHGMVQDAAQRGVHHGNRAFQRTGTGWRFCK